MSTDNLIGVLLRVLPAILVFVLGFVAAADPKTRARWGDLLYQIGSIRSDQREDVSVGKNVKWPFFVVALALLIWPVQYYRHASIKIDAKESDLKTEVAAPSDLKKKEEATTAGAATPTPTSSGPAVAPIPGATPDAPVAAPAPAGSPKGGDLKPVTPGAAPAPGAPSGGDLKPAPPPA